MDCKVDVNWMNYCYYNLCNKLCVLVKLQSSRGRGFYLFTHTVTAVNNFTCSLLLITVYLFNLNYFNSFFFLFLAVYFYFRLFSMFTRLLQLCICCL